MMTLLMICFARLLRIQIWALPPSTNTAASSSACRRPVTMTCAPWLANRLAVASPIPVDPPVTIAILPSSLRDMDVSLVGCRPERGRRLVLDQCNRDTSDHGGQCNGKKVLH